MRDDELKNRKIENAVNFLSAALRKVMNDIDPELDYSYILTVIDSDGDVQSITDLSLPETLAFLQNYIETINRQIRKDKRETTKTIH